MTPSSSRPAARGRCACRRRRRGSRPPGRPLPGARSRTGRDGEIRAENGDPTYDQLAAVLSSHALDPGAELGRLAAAMTYNVAMQNVDAHARNHSFVIENNAVSFAPLYDVAPAVEFTKLRTAALRVGGESRIERISAVHLILEARSWGLANDAAEQVVIGMLSALFDVMPDAAAGLPIAAATVQRTRSHVRDLLRRWRQR